MKLLTRVLHQEEVFGRMGDRACVVIHCPGSCWAGFEGGLSGLLNVDLIAIHGVNEPRAGTD